MRAAVAIILRDGEHGTEFLMMQRAKHENDPWSGQMSFPGGKIDPDDTSAKAAAVREAEEEVGVVLTEEDYVGRLDDLYGLKVNNRYSVHVSSFVFKLHREIRLKGNHEVADLVWVSMQHLDNPEHSHTFFHPKDNRVRMPAVMINEQKEQVLWGLSLRMLSILYDLLGQPMRVLSEEDYAALMELENRNIESGKIDKVTAKILQRAISNNAEDN